MALPTSQYVRRHYVTIPVAAWGAASTHAHNLNSGQGTGYTPNLAFVNKAYIVDANGILHPVNPAIARVSAVDATNVSVVVGETVAGAPQLVTALSAILGGMPVSAVLEVNTRFAHSQEIGVQAVSDESIGLPATIGLPIELMGLSPVSASAETVYVRTVPNGGDDGHDGHSAAPGAGIIGPWATLQKAFDYLMALSPLRHNVLVDVGAGTFADAVDWDLIECSDGARFWVVGNQPVATAGAAFKRLTITAGVAALTPQNQSQMVRLIPNGADAWVDNAAAPIALAAGDINKVVRFNDGAGGHVGYAMVANVDTTGGGLGAYIDLQVNSTLMPAVPAWATAVGTVWDIIDPTDTSWTVVSGNVAGANVIASPGAATQAIGAQASKYNCIANIRFTGTAQFTNCQRLATPNCLFEGSVTFNYCPNGLNAVNEVPQAGENFFWPAAVWLRIGFTSTGTANAYGGPGTSFTGSFSCDEFSGSLAGAVWTLAGGVMTIANRSDLVLAWCSFGPDTPALSMVSIDSGSRVRMSNMLLESQIVCDRSVLLDLAGAISWRSRALAGANTPAAGTATTHVTATGGLVVVGGASTVLVRDANANRRYEGINADAATNVVFMLTQLSNYVDELGIHEANFFGCGGWLNAYESFAWIESQAPGTWTVPSKPSAIGAFDFFLDHGSIVKIHPNLGVTKGAVDVGTAVSFVRCDHDSMFLHGNPDLRTPDFIYGAAGGAGLSCGNGAVLDALNGSVIEVGNLKANVAAGQMVMSIRYRSHITYGSDAASYVLANNAAATEKKIGGLALAPGHAIGALALLNDDYDVALNTREGCTERSV